MSLIVKIMHGPADVPGSEEGAFFSIYSDVVSAHFEGHDGEGGEPESMMRLWVREPIKTALVPGFCENEKFVIVGGPTYIMNESGKTITVFRPASARDLRYGIGNPIARDWPSTTEGLRAFHGEAPD